MNLDLLARNTPGSLVNPLEGGGWRLEIPAGPAGTYRLAQLDDYAHLRRGEFPWSPPLRLSLQARASHPLPPGTWGFGFWNDPFNLNLGLGGATRRLPALPNAAWFFFASPPNFLTLDDSLPAQGGLAACFKSPQLSSAALAALTPLLPFFALPGASQVMRRTARRWIRQAAVSLGTQPNLPGYPPTEWQQYAIDWQETEVTFSINGEPVLTSGLSPRPPLGLVLWIDNQYAALPPGGKIAFGTLENPTSEWIEIRGVAVT